MVAGPFIVRNSVGTDPLSGNELLGRPILKARYLKPVCPFPRRGFCIIVGFSPSGAAHSTAESL